MGPHLGYRWRSGDSSREGYRRILEEEHELLERRLRVLSKEMAVETKVAAAAGAKA